MLVMRSGVQHAVARLHRSVSVYAVPLVTYRTNCGIDECRAGRTDDGVLLSKDSNRLAAALCRDCFPGGWVSPADPIESGLSEDQVYSQIRYLAGTRPKTSGRGQE